MIPMSDNLRGALLMMAAMAAFTGNDTLLKAVTAEVPLFQSIVIRGAVTLVLLAGLAWARGGVRLRLGPRDTKVLGLRSVGEIGATLAFLSALQHMPLANLSAIMQSLPLVVTLLAALLFRERIGWRRLTAIGVGFAGVLLIIKPGGAAFDGWSVLGVVAMGCVALRDLSTRSLSPGVPSLAVTIYAALAVTVLGAVLAPFQGWVAVTPSQLISLAGAAVFLIGGYQFIIMAMRVGEVSAVTPFRYTSLLFAIVLGWITFGQLPDALTLAGAGIVIASGLFMLRRERQLGIT